MKLSRKFNLKAFFLLLVIPQTIIAQKVEIITNRLQIIDKKLEISYDILKNKKIQRFDVWVVITDSEGKTVNARTFNGDVGENQAGGKDKLITWDYNADGIVLNETVSVQLNANASIVPGAVNPGNALLKSMALPGWGLSSVDKGKPYWLLGVTTYGSLATSIMLLASSNYNYNKYKSTFDPDLSTNYFNKSLSQASASSIFGYTAIGIWLATGIWSIIKANNINNSLTAQNRIQKVIFFSQYDQVTNTSGFKLLYNF